LFELPHHKDTLIYSPNSVKGKKQCQPQAHNSSIAE
jgi:hypothetical protein